MATSRVGIGGFAERALRFAGLTGAAGFVLLLGGCGENAFTTPGQQGTESVRPRVEILQPAAGAVFAVDDSIVVRVNATDNRALQTVEVTGVAVRTGVAGTPQTVARFATRTITVGGGARAVRDTTVLAVLSATADTLSDRTVLIIATAIDVSGNRRSDTAQVSVTQPRVAIVAPVEGAVAPAGTPLLVRLRAADPIDGVASVRVTATGAVQGVFNVAAPTSGDSVTVAIPVPATARGTVTLVAQVTTRSGFTRRTDAVTVRLVDATPPAVSILEPARGFRIAVGDSVFTRVRVADAQGLTALQLSGFALRGDPNLGNQQRVERFVTKTVTFPSDTARLVTDTIIQRFLLAAADTLQETTVFLTATATDRAGNTRADTTVVSVGGPRVQITEPTPGAQFRAGMRVSVRVAAQDPVSRVRSLRLRTAGAFAADTTLTLPGLVARLDTVVQFAIPGSARGDLQITATVTNAADAQATSPVVAVSVLPPVQDVVAPAVTFVAAVPPRAERLDTLVVQVQATDSTRVDTTGVTVIATRRVGGTLRSDTVTRRAAGAPGTFRLALGDLGIAELRDTARVVLDVTAFAVDGAGNCGAAVIPSVPQSDRCVRTAGGAVLSASGAGTRLNVLAVPGLTVPLRVRSDTIADLVADPARRRLFASNISAGVVEVLPFGAARFANSLPVGAQPWGLALDRTGDTLFVANSGGTNISVVPLGGPQLREARRIRTADVNLFGVTYDIKSDSVSNVVLQDFSDRPQYLGQLRTGQIIYSTRPTSVRQPGTVRIIDASRDTTVEPNRGSEIFTAYAAPTIGAGVVVNALTAGLSAGTLLTVCPRRLLATQPDPNCVTGTASLVSDSLTALRRAGLTDTRFDRGVNINTIPLTDTTFVAVSTDRSTIAFGEGAAQPGRVLLFRSQADGTVRGTSQQTRDLLGNAAERVIGLALNQDGSLGAARGQDVYFFDNQLRLQGVVPSGARSGGIAVHPLNSNYPADDGRRRAFASGIDASGSPFVDVLDAFSFAPIRRIFLREAIIGALVAAPVPADDPDAGTLSLRLYGVTRSGIVAVGLTPADLN